MIFIDHRHHHRNQYDHIDSARIVQIGVSVHHWRPPTRCWEFSPNTTNHHYQQPTPTPSVMVHHYRHHDQSKYGKMGWVTVRELWSAVESYNAVLWPFPTSWKFSSFEFLIFGRISFSEYCHNLFFFFQHGDNFPFFFQFPMLCQIKSCCKTIIQMIMQHFDINLNHKRRWNKYFMAFSSSSKLPNCFLHSSSGLTVSKLFLVKNDLREHQNTRREKCWITESWRCGKMRRMPWLKRFTTTVYNPSEVLRTLQFVTTRHDICH